MCLDIRNVVSPNKTIIAKVKNCSLSLDVDLTKIPIPEIPDEYTDEQAQDAVFSNILAINGLRGVYDDITNTYTIEFGYGSAEGDMWYRGVGGALESIPLGTNGQTLKLVGGVPTWENVITAANTVVEYITSGDGILTSFTIAHGLGAEPNAIVTAASEDAAHIAYITKDATNITVYYDVAPPSGTNNLKFNYIANI